MIAIYQFTIGSFYILRDIQIEKNALDKGRLILYQLNNELHGRIKRDSILVGASNLSIFFESDYNMDGTFETISYSFLDGTIEKTINGNTYIMKKYCASSEVIGDSDFITTEIHFRDKNGIFLFKLRTGINPR